MKLTIKPSDPTPRKVGHEVTAGIAFRVEGVMGIYLRLSEGYLRLADLPVFVPFTPKRDGQIDSSPVTVEYDVEIVLTPRR